MIIKKILNNNAIVCTDSDGTEKIAMGRGIAFQQKPGFLVLKAQIEKIFVLNTEEMTTRFQQVVAEIPVEHILLTEKIISYAKETYKKDLHDSIYVSLPDHISTTLERYEQNMILKNPLLAEIQRFYPEEYAIALKALDFVEADTGVRFNEDEAGFIAMHFVNAEFNTDMKGIYAITKTIDAIVQIVKEYLHNTHDETSFAWYRFLTHVKFFVQRLYVGQDYAESNFELFDVVKNIYAKAFLCTEKIAEYIKQTHNHNISKEEMTYLTMHVQRLADTSKNSTALNSHDHTEMLVK